MNKENVSPAVLKRLFKMLFGFFPVLMPVTVACIVFSAVCSCLPAIFNQKIFAVVEQCYLAGDWAGAKAQILPLILKLAFMYFLSLCSVAVYNQLMAYITQGFLDRIRRTMFDGMQNLPVRFFDQNKHGDIMSRYTNDTDAVRELISRAMPQLINSAVIVAVVFGIMLYYSLWMTILIVFGAAVMMLVSKKFGGGSAKYFMRQQISTGKAEGFIQEMMNGSKVIKVFCHEEQAKDGFRETNEALFRDSFKAHAYANILAPVIMNIGNLLYVLTATVGGLLLLTDIKNVSISGMAFGISILVPFMNMTKQFTGNINNVSQQINAVVMAMAGAQRIFSLMDEEPEPDEGYVTLVNAEVADDGTITESEKYTGKWAWKHPHGDGTLSYTRLMGDVTLNEVDFSYVEGKEVLHNISVYAKPGQKVAFVGATGAGKTTITNLINRFYDIADGKIRYDGININKIKKSDLRRSLGVVLQETNLFTGTVLDNIRYGNLDATDEECVKAAELAGADGFITRLPDGYKTVLTNNGSNLSQGQRQLISIARAAVANPPVMILDEATSSIDTRTEAIVQRGMDKLMEGRTVFVIAHRLSTVRNSDVIMVLDHGSIIERGDHKALIEKRGVYYDLYTGAFELE